MNIKHLLVSSLVLVPALSFADTMLNISLTVDETNIEIADAAVTAEKAVLHDDGYTKVEATLLSETDEAATVAFWVTEEDRVLTNPTLDVQWAIPATVELAYESEECSCLDRDLVLVVTAAQK